MQVLEKILQEIEKLEKEHPYKVIGSPDTYGSYNEAWQDCLDRVEGIICSNMEDDGWIPVDEKLPDEGENPITRDFYEYEVTFKSDNVLDIRHYKYGRGHWWHGGQIVDEYVTAWRPKLEPYRPKEEKR